MTLVEYHGELGTIARSRDLEDFTTISNFAKIVQTTPTLHALMILTLADGMGTADVQWSDWKEQLVWNLFEKTKNYLEIGIHFFKKIDANRVGMEEQARGVLGTGFSEEIRAHFDQMPERYFRMIEPQLLTEHLQMFRIFLNVLKIIRPIFSSLKFVGKSISSRGTPKFGFVDGIGDIFSKK